MRNSSSAGFVQPPEKIRSVETSTLDWRTQSDVQNKRKSPEDNANGLASFEGEQVFLHKSANCPSKTDNIPDDTCPTSNSLRGGGKRLGVLFPILRTI